MAIIFGYPWQLNPSAIPTESQSDIPEETIDGDEFIVRSSPTLSNDQHDGREYFVSNIRNFTPATKNKTKSGIKVFYSNIQANMICA